MSKNLEEAMDFLNDVAEVSRGWDEQNKGEVRKTKSQPNAFNAKSQRRIIFHCHLLIKCWRESQAILSILFLGRLLRVFSNRNRC